MVKVRFVAVAAVTTLGDVGACTGLCFVLPKALAYIIAFSLALCFRFLLDRWFTFRSSDDAITRQFLRYVVACLGSLVLGLLVFNWVLTYGLAPVLAKIISIPPVTVFGYLAFRFFVFGSREKRGGTAER